MGVRCKVLRNPVSNEIVGVETPNGENSILYKNFLDYSLGNQDKALSLWTIAYTDGFKEVYGDWEVDSQIDLDVNNEPRMENVIEYLKITSRSNLSDNDVINIQNLNKKGIGLNEAVSNFKDSFLDEDGVFTVNESRLKSVGLFTELEIDQILNNTDLQNSIKNTVYGLTNSSYADMVFEDIDLSTLNLFEIYSNTTSPNGKIGLSPNIVDINDIILEKGVNVNSKEELVELIKENTTEDEFDQIVNDVNNLDAVYNYLENSKAVKVKYGNFEVVKNDTFQKLKNTLIINQYDPILKSNINILTHTDLDVLIESSDVVDDLVSDIVLQLIPYGVDVIGLENKYGSNVELFVDFLNNLDSLLESISIGTVTDEQLGDFSQLYDSLFNIEQESLVNLINIDNFVNESVSFIKEDLSPLQAYENGLVKIDENLYQEVDNSVSFDENLETITTEVINDPFLFGKEMLYPNFVSKGKVDMLKITNPNNRQLLKQNIKEFVDFKLDSLNELINKDSIDALRNITIYNFLNGVDYKRPSLNTDDLNQKYILNTSVEIDQNYFDNHFLSNLNQKILKEKFVDSDMYNSVLKYIGFNDNGIFITSNNPLIKYRINNLLPNTEIYNELKLYLQSSFNQNTVDSIDNFEGQPLFIPESFVRAYYFNNPTLVKALNTDYSYKEGVVFTKKTNEPFIKTQEGIFELSSDDRGVSIYRGLSGEVSTNKMYSPVIMNERFVDNVEYANLIKPSTTSSINVVSSSVREELLNELQNCK